MDTDQDIQPWRSSLHLITSEYWDRFRSSFSSDRDLFVWGTLAVTVTSYWIPGLLYLILDITRKPQWLVKFKIQQELNSQINLTKLLQSVLWVVFNTIFLACVFNHAVYPLVLWRGCALGGLEELPSIYRVLLEVSVFVVAEETLFYYSHRLLHHPSLYKHIHKKHHEWISPVGIVADYSHPLEHVISNIVPMFTGPLLMGSHILVMWPWFVVALVNTCISHSGYHLPFLPSPQAHDYHHLKFNNNFGSSGVLDWLHGTDNHFQKSIQAQRNVISFSLTPIHNLIVEK